MSEAKKILFVDDEPMITMLMKKRLQANGYKVETAASGDEAMEKAQKTRFDMILLDIMMPRIDGYETCRRLKADPLTREIPVIMFTASLEENFIHKGRAAGALEVVNKPYVAEALKLMKQYFLTGRIETGDEDDD